MTTVAEFFSSWLPVVVWASGIYYLSSIPSLNSGFGIWDVILRKIAHMTEFGVLTGLLLRAFRRSAPFQRHWLMLFSGVFAFLYAISDEYHQSFVPGRTPSARDVMIDCIGITVMLIIFFKRNRVRE